MKKLNYVYLLSLLLIVSGTAYSQPTIYKSVPDSLVCYTPEQDLFFIGQAFTIKGLQTTVVLKDKQLALKDAVIAEKDGVITEKEEQKKLEEDKNKNCQTDLKVEKDKVKNMENKTLLQKVVLWVAVPVVVVETLYIAVIQVIKK